MSPRPRYSPRRLALFGVIAVLLGAVAWLHFTGAAGTRGTELKDMDWNGDGVASQAEWLQSLYAVVVQQTVEGARECRTYAWRGDGRVIRVDCRTSVKPDAPAEK